MISLGQPLSEIISFLHTLSSPMISVFIYMRPSYLISRPIFSTFGPPRILNMYLRLSVIHSHAECPFWFNLISARVEFLRSLGSSQPDRSSFLPSVRRVRPPSLEGKNSVYSTPFLTVCHAAVRTTTCVCFCWGMDIWNAKVMKLKRVARRPAI